MAGKTVKYTIDIELAKSQEKITRLEASVKKLNDAVHVGDNRTKKQRKNKEDLAKTQERLTKATQKHIVIQAQASGAHANSTSAINKQIQALQAENRMIDVNSAKYKQNTAAISQHANKMNQATGATGGATSATMELSRVVSDAPYGIRGVANNLSQFTSQMYYASAAAGGLGAALKQIGRLMLGPLGIVFAITAVISALDWYSARSKKAEDASKSWREEMAEATSGTKATSAELEQYGESVNNAAVGTNEYENALKELKNNGYDPLTQSVEDFIEVQQKLIILNATKEVFSKELKQLAEEKYLLDQAVSDANKRYVDTLEENATGKKTSRSGGGGTGDKFDRAIDAKTEELVATNLVVAAEENITEQSILRAGKMEQMNRSAERYKDIIQEILQLTSQSSSTSGSGGGDNAGKSLTGAELDLSKQNDKNRKAELMSVVATAEAKQLIKDEYAKAALKASKTRFDNQQLLRRDNFIKAQELRKSNNVGNAFIQADADRLIEGANDTHEATMLQSRTEYLVALGILEDTQDTATFNRQMDRESNAVDHELKMQALAIEGAKYIKNGRHTVEVDQYDEKKAQAEEEQSILNARIQALAVDSDERLKLEEKYADKSVEIKNNAAEREIEIEQAKADFRDQMLGHIGAGLGAASKLFKKNSTEAKVFALAEIAVGTARGMINGLIIAQKTADANGPASAFTFPLYYASQVASVLGAAASAKSILQGGSGGSAARSSSAGSPAAFTPEFNVVGNSNENQLAEGISGQVNTPTRAYVVYEDIAEAGAVSDSSIEQSGI
tara:strand:- start:1749 stop:4124 length:2376 start_codon:yes stop_codon:yes gene_type:complete